MTERAEPVGSSRPSEASNTATGRAWARAVRQTLDGRAPTYGVWIASARPEHAPAIEARLRSVLADCRTAAGDPPRVLVIPERARHPGNLVGTLLTWRDACARAQAAGWELPRALADGTRIALVHAAGLGRRAAPLVYAEHGDRGALWLPGRLAGRPARVLTAVLAQVAPLARSQPDGFLDVFWASQLFLPAAEPDAVPAPTRALTKLTTAPGPAASELADRADVGVFLQDDGGSLRFVPQGHALPAARGARLHRDLGSFRLRADLLEVWTRLYLDPRPDGPRDLDPHFTGPLLGHGGAPWLAEARAVQEALGEPELIGLTELGTDLPWWRLRRPAELRTCAMDVRPGEVGSQALRTLLGVEHPVSRSWLGDTWIEGEELSWEEVQGGVEVGGVWLQDSIVQDSAVWPWPRGGVARPALSRCVLQGSTGAFDLEDAWLVGSGGPTLRGGGGLAWRVTAQPPAAAGPSPTATGLCTVRRRRLPDGEITVHDFLHEDAKETAGERRASGVSWEDLAALPVVSGPALGARIVDAELDERPPHLLMAPPIAAVALLRERLPPRTSLIRLLELVEDGRFHVALHDTPLPVHTLDAPLALGRVFHRAPGRPSSYHLHADLQTWRRWTWAPPRVAEALLHTLVLHLLPAGRLSRDQVAADRLARFRRGHIEASPALQAFLEDRVQDQDIGAVLDRADAWSLEADPDRIELAALHDALDVLAPEPRALRTPEHLRAWLRWRLERRKDVIGTLTDRLDADGQASLLARCGFRWSHPWQDHGAPCWLPRWDLAPRRPPDQVLSSDDFVGSLVRDLATACRDGAAPVLGICGPAAAGKSSVAVSIAERLDDAHVPVQVVSADRHTWAGDGFRYDQHAAHRDTRLYGPGIVDELGLAARIDALTAPGHAVIVEGCYVGRDPAVRERLTRLVGVLLDDRARLDAKYARDALGGLRQIDVVTDFADKVQHESRDGVAPALAHAERVWDRGTGACWLSPVSP